jgi:hypothetical protein
MSYPFWITEATETSFRGERRAYLRGIRPFEEHILRSWPGKNRTKFLLIEGSIELCNLSML